MYDAMMEDWCNRGGTQFDFTIGNEDFKSDFGTMPIGITSYADNATLTGLLATKGMQLANAARPHLNSMLKISSKIAGNGEHHVCKLIEKLGNHRGSSRMMKFFGFLQFWRMSTRL